MNSVEDIVINKSSTLKEALKQLNKVGSGLLFVINENNKLLGVLTDGDIRRFLINDNNLGITITKVMNDKFIALPVSISNAEILEVLSSKIKIIPLLNENKEVVDYASINRLRRIPIASPMLNGNELVYLTECIQTNWISSQGKYVSKFEKLFSEFHNSYTALAVSNGTVALHLALETLGIGKGDEVIVPNLTFAASINAVIYTGAKPVLVDVEERTLNIDVTKIEALITEKTKAIMPVHLYGQPCEMDVVQSIANKHRLYIIEDCAEALGSKYKGQNIGSFGDASTFSFFGNKTITTGEGGMVLFKNPKHHIKASLLRDHGMSKEKRYWHDVVGYNYRLTNIQAAIGVAQFEKLDVFLKVKKEIAKKYDNILSKYSFFKIPKRDENIENTYWLYTFLIDENAPFKREEFMKILNNKGIDTRPVFYPLHVMPPYKKYTNNDNYPVSLKVSSTGVSLPTSANLSILEVDYICNNINEFVNKYIV